MTDMRIEVSSDLPPVGTPPDGKVPVWVWAVSAAMIGSAVAGAGWAGVPLPVALIAAVVLLLVLALANVRRFAPVRRRPAPPRVERRWIVTGTGIELTEAQAVSGWRWPALVAVDETPAAYVFRQADRRTVNLPRAGLTEEQETQLRTFLSERGLLI
ncbi:YcxB family protein [Paractinoplanes durhamensis]|uniref:YcxB-like protein domain-containing protein n=1 Tax=Paractinoplanes durhamensis TaxID=113563 RepID=A0ABQ3YQT8_9ACTN|nr:YcxB family protein [Actinoplanes durhamensis]GID99940.1 hypothetical protein Adu01nite_12910 [Actinoplanes durhamensis]